MNWFQAKSYLSYLIHARHRKGFGIHSPFVFDLVANLMQESHPYYIFQNINAWRNSLLGSNNYVEVTDMGAGSVVTKFKKRKVADIVRHGSIPKKYGEFIFRLVSRFKPKSIIELGTSAGISALYMALPDKNTKFFTIEGCPNMADLARFTFENHGLNQITLLNGLFNDQLPNALIEVGKLDLVFFDGDHREEPTVHYFNLCCEQAHNDTIFIFDDIHWSEGMAKAWQTIIDDPRVTVSIDLFRLGIVFFRRECQKAHYVVRF